MPSLLYYLRANRLRNVRTSSPLFTLWRYFYVEQKLLQKADARVQFCSDPVRSHAYFPEWKPALSVNSSELGSVRIKKRRAWKWQKVVLILGAILKCSAAHKVQRWADFTLWQSERCKSRATQIVPLRTAERGTVAQGGLEPPPPLPSFWPVKIMVPNITICVV